MAPKKENKGGKGQGKGSGQRPPDVLGTPGGGGGGIGFILHLADEKAGGTNGGSFGGGWQTRELNVKKIDEIGSTLSSNQFTLPAGTYHIEATAPACGVDDHQLRLRNITDNSTLVSGMAAYAFSTFDVQTTADLTGRFTLTGTKTLELQHIAVTALATIGLGFSTADFGEVDTFATVWIRKVA